MYFCEVSKTLFTPSIKGRMMVAFTNFGIVWMWLYERVATILNIELETGKCHRGTTITAKKKSTLKQLSL